MTLKDSATGGEQTEPADGLFVLIGATALRLACRHGRT